jgi:hypothetical protein
LVIRAPSIALNPTLDQKIVDQALEEDPAAANAEWLAQFRDDVTGWASRELIEAAVDRGVTVRPPVPGIFYQSFCDASGGVRDSFTMAVAHAEDRIAVLDCLVEIRPPFNPDSATAQVSEALKAYRCRSTVGDKYAAEWVVQAFRKCGIVIDTQSAIDPRSIWTRFRYLPLGGRGSSTTNALFTSSRHLSAVRHRPEGIEWTTARQARTTLATQRPEQWCSQ